DERPAAADLHLDDQRLALVQRHAAVFADRLVAPGRRQALLVERMSRLVQDPHEAGGETGLVPARGDARIVRNPAREGMQTDVEPAPLEIEAEGAHQSFRERVLNRSGEMPFRWHGSAPRRLALDRLLDQRGQEGRELAENAVDLLGAAAGIILVEQGI